MLCLASSDRYLSLALGTVVFCPVWMPSFLPLQPNTDIKSFLISSHIMRLIAFEEGMLRYCLKFFCGNGTDDRDLAQIWKVPYFFTRSGRRIFLLYKMCNRKNRGYNKKLGVQTGQKTTVYVPLWSGKTKHTFLGLGFSVWEPSFFYSKYIILLYFRSVLFKGSISCTVIILFVHMWHV